MRSKFIPRTYSNTPQAAQGPSLLTIAAKRAITFAGLPEPQTNEEMLTGMIEVASKLKQMYEVALRDRQTTQAALLS
jgi:hypothetical protein